MKVNESCISRKVCKINSSGKNTIHCQTNLGFKINQNYCQESFWTTFDSSVGYLFEGVNDPTKPEGPFDNATRSLLVDSILRNFTFSTYSNRAHLKMLSSINHAIQAPINFVSSLTEDDKEIEIDYQKGYVFKLVIVIRFNVKNVVAV